MKEERGSEIRNRAWGSLDRFDGGSKRKQGGKDDSQFFSLNNWVSWFTKAENAGKEQVWEKAQVFVLVCYV